MTKYFEFALSDFVLSEPKDNAITISNKNDRAVISVEKGWYKLTIPDSQNDRVIAMEKDFKRALYQACLMLISRP